MEDVGHERVLELAMLAAFADLDLAGAAEDAAVAPITDSGGDAVAVDEVLSMEAAGFMTTNRGVAVRLSDGSEFTVEIKAYRAPRG